ncbi:autotransporter outer membrane beta-barrel domain-containing protein [Erwinia sp. CGal63]|uniref:autotransporter outer membrane beta-barrel domain-containing protein n=1 Tax=Erwinia sp. CGal63 TaxID=2919889 RepID=UPI00300A2FFF
MFKLHPLFLSLIAAQGAFIPASAALAATLKPFSPYVNDNKAGVFCVCNGSTQTLSGVQQFSPGLTGEQSFSLGYLREHYGGRTDYSLVGQSRLDPGSADYTITLPDTDGSGNNTFDVFNSANMVELPAIGMETEVPNYVDVNGGQYINARVAQVSKGTINVDIGEAGAASTAETNGWQMAAKQSRLFTASGSGNMNWESNNRLTFTSVPPPYGGPYLNYPVDNVAFYQGAFSVTTKDNVTTNFNVTSFNDFKNYNNWLIEQLQSGRLSPDSYRSELDKAVVITSGNIVYNKVMQNDNDEAAQPVGDLIVLSADGPKATVSVKAGAVLEVVNASSAVQASNGATAIVDGKVSSTGNGANTVSQALELLSGSKGINNGVINGGFFNKADGTGVDSATVDYSNDTVALQDGSRFINNGVINSTGRSNTLSVYGGSAVNNGTINVGVSDWSSAQGVSVNGGDASFVNAEGGTLYLGRSPQNKPTDETTDVHLNNSVGIHTILNGRAVNNGRIVLGSLTEGSVAMQADNAPNGQMLNNGVIDIDGRATLQPEENIGMLAIDAGSDGLVGNAGTINLNGGNSTGIKVLSVDGSASVWSSGSINVNGGSETAPSRGVLVSGFTSTFTQQGAINLNGDSATGAMVERGGSLIVDKSSSLTFHHDNQTGYLATGYNAIIYSNGPTIDVSAANATLYQLNLGNFYATSAGDITLSGAASSGIVADGGYAGSTDRFTVSGDGATAVKALNSGSVTISSPLVLNGDNALGGYSDTDYSVVSNRSEVTGAGSAITGFDVGYILSNSGRIDLTGANNTGVRLRNGALFNTGSIQVASGIALEASEGDSRYFPESAQLVASDGIAAVRVNSGANFSVLGDGIFRNLIEGDGSADGIRLEKGVAGLSVDGTTITVTGSGSALNNLAETTNIAMTSTYIYARGNGSSGIRSAVSIDPQGSVTIEPSGGATGYTFANADGSTTSNDMLLPRGMAILTGDGGTGIRAKTTGQVITEGNIYVTREGGGSAIVTSTASEVINRGEIYSWSTVAPVIDLRGGQTVFINEGSIGAEYPDTPLVVGGATNDEIALVGGAVNGDIDTGEGTDTLALTGGTINGNLTMGGGVDNQAFVQNVSLANVGHITTAGGEGSTLSLSEIAASGGTFASDDPLRGVNLGAGWSTINFYRTAWTLTDNLKLAHSTINIDGASTLYAGNNVNPVLTGGTNDSLTVNNAGTLDLTNGAGSPGNTLTINGTLNSLNGTLKLVSALSGEQNSDTLRVNGDVNGITLINVTPAAGSGVSQNAPGDASRGVSLAQVAGNASADSFALQGGYLAAGPWRYDLYSFAPGSSDAAQRLVDGSGNQFWDYRLANGIVSEGSSSRAAVVPQVPSYVSAPVGLAYYSAATLNDLHNRLGELRQSQDRGSDGEMFLRYTGANMRYSTSQSFRDFGYNVDMDYSALQVGGNVLHLDGENGSLRGGVAYTRGNSRIRPDAADGYSSTAFDSDTLALYSTWLQESGFYLDGTLSYSWHRGETDIARKQDVAKIKGKGWSASLESGYPVDLVSGIRLEPQAQLTYLHLGLDNFSDKENLAVKYDDYDQTIGRVGAKLDRRWSDAGGREYTPWLRANYYKGWGGQAKTTVGAKGTEGLEQRFSSGKFGQMWEIGVGGTAAFTDTLSLYAEADYRKEIDGNGGKGWGYNAGVRWTF